ncbi:MAG: hypothetical protein SV186_05420 [Candidatus Nanohaloarchaea archaeon]|nr:hypothetical protein [Candidatus Nanohaloarchaea archaeon]
MANLPEFDREARRSLGILVIGLVLLLVAGWLRSSGFVVMPVTIGFAGVFATALGIRGLDHLTEGTWEGVAALTGIWILFFATASVVGSWQRSLFTAVLGLLMLGAWIGLPLLLYLDIVHVRRDTEWQPIRLLYLPLAVFPLINMAVGLIYLYRRHTQVGEP